MEEKAGQLKTHSTISKKARGAFLTACMATNCQTVDSLKSLVFSGFHYHPELSTDREFVYIKKEVQASFLVFIHKNQTYTQPVDNCEDNVGKTKQ